MLAKSMFKPKHLMKKNLFFFVFFSKRKYYVAEQRVTGFLLLAGERMGTKTRISLAASFMSGGGF
jgi:hypothetical protein